MDDTLEQQIEALAIRIAKEFKALREGIYSEELDVVILEETDE
jgi:hypothetical protein